MLTGFFRVFMGPGSLNPQVLMASLLYTLVGERSLRLGLGFRV